MRVHGHELDFFIVGERDGDTGVVAEDLVPRGLVDEVAVVLLERERGEDFLAVGQEEVVEFGAGGRLEGGDCWVESAGVSKDIDG